MDYYDEPQEPSEVQRLEHYLKTIDHQRMNELVQLNQEITTMNTQLQEKLNQNKQCDMIYFIVLLVAIFIGIILFVCTFSKMCSVLKQGVNLKILSHV